MIDTCQTDLGTKLHQIGEKQEQRVKSHTASPKCLDGHFWPVSISTSSPISRIKGLLPRDGLSGFHDPCIEARIPMGRILKVRVAT